MSTRRVVLLTLAAVLAVLVLTAAGLAGGLAYFHERGKRQDAERAMKKLREQLVLARATATAARLRADSARGAGYARGYRVGYNDAFSGYSEWKVGRYYIVQVEKGSGPMKYDLPSRILMERCQNYTWESDSVFTSPSC